MVSLQARVANIVFRCMPKDKPGQPHDYAAERKRNDRKPPKPPKGVQVSFIDLDGLSGEKICKDGNDKGLVFYIHGGGFCTGSAKERREICQMITARYGYNCITFNYRLAPEHKWPAQPEDCLTAYKAVLNMGVDPSQIVFMGESAGGTLVLSIPLWLKELGLPQPKAIVSFSPCVNQAEHYPSHFENAKTDYILRDAVAKGMGEPVFGERSTDIDFLRTPYVSVINGNYAGLPPIFLSASDSEALLDDSRMLYKKLKNEGHSVFLEIKHGLCHAFPVMPFMPESRQTLQAVFSWLGKSV